MQNGEEEQRRGGRDESARTVDSETSHKARRRKENMSVKECDS